MRKFLSLPQAKQERIVGAAMTLFGEVGYKKAYVSEIASTAGISKALVFHYFGSKRGLYSYLVYYTGKIVMTEAQHERDTAGKDFFDRALITIKFRLSLKKRYPAMNSFIQSVYKEDDAEVSSEVERLLAIASDMHAGTNLTPGEEQLIRSGVAPLHVVNLVRNFSEGVINSYVGDAPIDEAAREAEECLQMLRKVL